MRSPEHEVVVKTLKQLYYARQINKETMRRFNDTGTMWKTSAYKEVMILLARNWRNRERKANE